jgi:hypothetical protein
MAAGHLFVVAPGKVSVYNGVIPGRQVRSEMVSIARAAGFEQLEAERLDLS